MTLRAVFFDVGETLVDEERYWRDVAHAAGLRPHVVWAALGKTIERGEEHRALWGHLGVERPAACDEVVYSADDLYPDVLDCLRHVRVGGMLVGVAGNQSAALEEWTHSLELPVDLVLSSASLGVSKPDPRFFERLVEVARAEPEEVAYVGDRADNDALPALEAGLVAYHLRRGPWGRLQTTPPGAIALESLAELPARLGHATVAGA